MLNLDLKTSRSLMLILVVILALQAMVGCSVVKDSGRDLVSGASEQIRAEVTEVWNDFQVKIEKKLTVVPEDEARRTLKLCLDEGFPETALDVNLDGEITREEQNGFIMAYQQKISQQAITAALGGKSWDEIWKDWLKAQERLRDTLGGGGLATLAAWHVYRNKTRKKDLENGNPNGHPIEIDPPSMDMNEFSKQLAEAVAKRQAELTNASA